MTRRPSTPPVRPRAIDERAFHRWLARTLPAGQLHRLPLGDDAAAVPLPAGTVAVVSTDALVEGTHFLPEAPARAVGAAASSVSLSDVAAKGAVPLAVFLAVIVPAGSPQRWAEELVRGAERQAGRFGAHVLGGDTKPGPHRSVVSTVVGAAPPGRLVGRRGARPGDVLLTTGTVGRGGAAARRLADRRTSRRAAAVALLEVTPRVREGRALAGFAHAMLDTSDGLGESCWLLAAASRVRLVVEERSLPLVPGLARLAAGPRRAAAFFGGDYELLAAVPRRAVAGARAAVAAAGGTLTPIGQVERGRGAELRSGGRSRPMPHAGWVPFRARGTGT